MKNLNHEPHRPHEQKRRILQRPKGFLKYFLHNIFLSLSSVREVRVGRGLFFLGFFSALVSCASRELEEPPIITSATYQHTLYNGKPQPIEVSAAKEGAPFIVTYFTSEENLEQDKGGTETPPTQAGVYYARVRRPAWNGYKAGRDIKVEYHLQKALPPVSEEKR